MFFQITHTADVVINCAVAETLVSLFEGHLVMESMCVYEYSGTELSILTISYYYEQYIFTSIQWKPL